MARDIIQLSIAGPPEAPTGPKPPVAIAGPPEAPPGPKPPVAISGPENI